MDFMRHYRPLLPYQKETVGSAEANISTAQEGTLYLSVTSPNLKSSKPVMVWFHGGGWRCGGVEQYDSTPISAFGDVVVVNLSYRLEIFGFLFGNWAIHDMILGLKWVKENISNFGGDPNNVTIFGESAGGWSVEALLATELSKGLFHKAIAQSGTLRSILKFQTVTENPTYQKLMTRYHVTSIKDLKAKLKLLSTSEILELAVEMSQQKMTFMQLFDHEVFKERPDKKIAYKNRVPILLGTNDSEAGGIVAELSRLPLSADKETVIGILQSFIYGDQTNESRNKAEELYPKIDNVYQENDQQNPMHLYKRALGDFRFHGTFLRADEVCSDQPVFCYNLRIQTQAHHNSEPKKEDWVNADHADDLLYVFGYPFNGRTFYGGQKFTDEEVTLSKRMISDWTMFAKTGNSGWSQYDTKDRAIKIYDKKDSMFSGNDKNWQKRCQFLKEVLE